MRLGAPLSRWPATARANVEHVDEMHPGLIDQTADAAYHKVHEYLSREFPGLAAAARQALSIASADLARHLTLALCTSPSGGDASPPHRRRRTVAPPEATSDLAADLATAPKASLSRCFTSAAPKEAKGGAAPAVFVAMHAGSAPESAALLAHAVWALRARSSPPSPPRSPARARASRASPRRRRTPKRVQPRARVRAAGRLQTLRAAVRPFSRRTHSDSHPSRAWSVRVWGRPEESRRAEADCCRRRAPQVADAKCGQVCAAEEGKKSPRLCGARWRMAVYNNPTGQ